MLNSFLSIAYFAALPAMVAIGSIVFPAYLIIIYKDKYLEERNNGNLKKSRTQIFDRYKKKQFTLPNIGMIFKYPKDYLYLSYLEILTVACAVALIAEVFPRPNNNIGITDIFDILWFSGLWLVYFEYYSFRRILLYREYKKNTSQNEQEKPSSSYKNSGHKSKQNSYNDDDFAFKKEKFNDPEEGRFNDDRFESPRYRAKYEAMLKGYKEPTGDPSEQGKQFTFIRQADLGKQKGIKPWKPKDLDNT